MIPKSGNKNIDNVIMYGGILLLVIIIYKLSKFIISPLQSVKDELGVTPDTPNYNPETIPVDYTKTNYPETQFQIWADSLEDAIWSTFGEDEETIKGIMFQINSDEDLKAIIKAYGNRTSALGITGGNLVSSLRQYTPELIEPFNYHFAGFNMKTRI